MRVGFGKSMDGNVMLITQGLKSWADQEAVVLGFISPTPWARRRGLQAPQSLRGRRLEGASTG